MRTRPRRKRSRGHANSIRLPILYFIKRKYVNLIGGEKARKTGNGLNVHSREGGRGRKLSRVAPPWRKRSGLVFLAPMAEPNGSRARREETSRDERAKRLGKEGSREAAPPPGENRRPPRSRGREEPERLTQKGTENTEQIRETEVSPNPILTSGTYARKRPGMVPDGPPVGKRTMRPAYGRAHSLGDCALERGADDGRPRLDPDRRSQHYAR